MRTFNQEMVPRQAIQVVARRAAGKWVLLDVKTGQYHALDPVAGRIWQLCDGTRNVRQIAKVVSAEYHAAGQAVDDDVVGLVSELVGELLLVCPQDPKDDAGAREGSVKGSFLLLAQGVAAPPGYTLLGSVRLNFDDEGASKAERLPDGTDPRLINLYIKD